MSPPSMGRLALGWAARLALLLSGASMAVRLGIPAPPAVEDSGKQGRGKPGVPPSPRAKAAGHETEDMSGGTMARLVIGLGVAVALVVCVVLGLRFVVQRFDTDTRPPVTAEQATHLAPPPPNLQNDPVGDLPRLREAESRLLDNYAWIDAAHTRGRVPIERAMALIVGHPLDTAP